MPQQDKQTSTAITAITGFLKFLADDEIIQLDMIERWQLATDNLYRPVKSKGLRKRKYFDPRELEEIIFQLSQNTANAHQRDRDTSFFAAIMLGPTRLGDLIRAELQHVQFLDSRMISNAKGQPQRVPPCARIHLTKEQTKDHEERDILIFAGDTVGGVEILPFFKSYHEWRMTLPNTEPTGPVFTSTRRRPGDFLTPRNMFARIKRHARNVEFNASAHMFRGTWAEINGGRLESREIRQLLGHSADKTSQGYTDQPNDERLLKARLRASEAISHY